MDPEASEAIRKLLSACNEVELAQKRLATNDARLRRSVQHLTLAARSVQELLDQEDSTSRE